MSWHIIEYKNDLPSTIVVDIILIFFKRQLPKTNHQTFTWEQKINSIECVVLGLIYLHSFVPPVIHGDLKSRNIRLDSTKGTKLTDFGESREFDDDTLTSNIGTFKWMAPEVMLLCRCRCVVLTECLTHHSPYIRGEIQPTMDTTNTPAWLQDLANRCLTFNPEERPSTMEICSLLRPAKKCCS
ncbi:kinase [Thraustotheca clavata]|uniref:Kinase n=1 Tax=Thraustotheca clavata TaxID=74557 RepID=A0A1W0AAV0_9STRA|nr:kinase [Thraustotheca clavata]